MKKLLLHLGRAKTGSSSLQETFGNASDSLRQQGVMYPAFRPFNHSFQFTVLFKNDPRETFYYRQFAPANDAEWEAEKARLRRQWVDFFSSAERGTWIVSAENLPATSEDEIESLMQFVRPFFDDIVAMVYVRHPESALKSQWEEFVKVMEAGDSGHELLARTVRNYNFHFLDRWSNVLGRDRLIVRPFSPSRFVGGTLQSDFLHHAGLDELELPLAKTIANISVGAEGAAFLQAYNRRYPLYCDGVVNPRRGLVRHQHLLFAAMRNVPAQPLDFAVRFNAEEAAYTNRQIELANTYLAPADRFDTVEASDQPSRLPDASAVSVDYLLDLVNEMALRIDRFVEPK